ncbi:MAG TPA: F0F1 ATP synthase subunit B [Phenylobacterium sp.]|nr:F0F1 ATP synthase subunit B [Phenylobacterium sp.]
MPPFLIEMFRDSHFWVGVAFVIFVLLMVRFGVHKLAWNALGESGRKIQAQLDEATRLREEAQGLLNQIKVEREEAEKAAKAMLANAEEEAKRLQVEAKAKLEDQIKRRADLAERKIATAEAQAQADVKAAAAELAAQMTEQVLVQRLAGTKSDPLIDLAIGQMGAKLQ